MVLLLLISPSTRPIIISTKTPAAITLPGGFLGDGRLPVYIKVELKFGGAVVPVGASTITVPFIQG